MKNQRYCLQFVKFLIGLNLLWISFFAYGASGHIQKTVSDTAITAQIKAKYLKNPLLNVFNIGVETNNGLVKLSGQVESDAQYERAIIIAQNTEGVKSINADNLTVKSSQQPLTDTFITAKVKALFIKNNLANDENDTNLWKIHVETKNGTVYLTGEVDSDTQKKEAEKIAKLVDGVKSVKVDLTIKKL